MNELKKIFSFRFFIGIALIPFGIIYGFLIYWIPIYYNYSTLILLLLSIPILFLVISTFSTILRKTLSLGRQLRWWHLLWLLLFLSGLVFRVRYTEAIKENLFDIWSMYRIILVGVVGILIFFWYLMRIGMALRFFLNGLIGLMTIFSLINIFSTFWSVFPSWTLYKSIEYFIDISLIACIVALSEDLNNYKSIFDWTYFLYMFLLLLTWIGVFLWPSEAIYHGIGLLGFQIIGVIPALSANAVGELGALLGIVSFVRFYLVKNNSDLLYKFIFIISIITLVFSQSRSPLAGFFLAILLILLITGKIRTLSFIILLLIIIGVFTEGYELFYEYFLRKQSQNLFWSLSGRVTWWDAAHPYIVDNIWFGNGAYAAGRFIVAILFGSTLSSLHSTWHEVLIGTGIIGLLPLLFCIFGVWLVLLRTKIYEYSALAQQLRLESIGIITILSVRSIFTVSFIWHPSLSWLLVLGYCVILQNFSIANYHYSDPK